jgi:diacylglycerol kinase family enzyme
VKLALIHNPNAFRGEAEGSQLRRVFERSGHSVEYVSTRDDNWQRVISPEIARVIIVGGDGTVQLVAPHLKGTPFSILPFGTANNIAQCLQQTPHTELLASQLDQAKICHLDLGRVTHGDESKTFLEAAGMGVFVELILAMQDWPKKLEMEQAESRKEKFAHALEELQAISRRSEGTAWELKVDDTVITDRFLLIAVMNMELIGPRLHWPRMPIPATVFSILFWFVRGIEPIYVGGSNVNHPGKNMRRIWRAGAVDELSPAQAMLLLFTLTAI